MSCSYSADMPFFIRWPGLTRISRYNQLLCYHGINAFVYCWQIDDRGILSIKAVFAVKISEMITFPKLYVALVLDVRVHLVLHCVYQAKTLDL